ncbi:MAG: hypothetical protein JRI80_00260 [Deltaproteobacteria bacterium]|nr:hypothetical protein [Deltaproteobacteria bacterium]
MNWAEFETAFADLQQRKLALMRGKSDDYARPEDRFWNFKAMAGATLRKPEQTILSMIAVKLTRLANLFEQRTPPKNEPVLDSVIDMANYCDLLALYLDVCKVCNGPGTIYIPSHYRE